MKVTLNFVEPKQKCIQKEKYIAKNGTDTEGEKPSFICR